MDFFIKRVKTLYENSSSILLASALVYAFTSMWALDVTVFFILAVSLLTIVVIRLLESAKNKAFAVVLPFLIVIFILLLCRLLKFDITTHFKGLSGWAYQFFTSGGERNALYAYLLTGTLAVAVSILCKLLDKIYAARVAVAAALFAGGIVLTLNRLDMPKFSVCMGFFYILNRLIEIVNNTVNRKIRMKDSKIFASYLMPICMLAAILAAVLPSKPEPIGWEGVKHAASVVANKAELLLTEIQLLFGDGNGFFSVSFSGYSEGEKNLGGTILSNDSVMLNIKALTQTNANLYLTGAVRNEYTGNRWRYTVQDENFGMSEYELDFYELLNAFDRQGIPAEELQTLLERRNYLLTYDDVKTKTLFYPIKSYSFELSDSSRGANLSQSNLLFKRVKGRETSYSVEFTDVNYESEAFRNMLRNLEGFSYSKAKGFDKSFIPYLKEYFGRNKSITLYTDVDFDAVYARRAEKIKADYLTLPQTLPERVRTLSEDITKGYDNSYDKLKALEAYLNTYQYTTEPPEVPKDRDFTDYFLFDQRQGYCTYFATAMAVMGRCIGIPTRYVEGAAVDYADKLEDSYYNVPNKNAHAWAEAYIEGVGWIPFEPTSGYSSSRYSQWQTDSGISTSSPSYSMEDYLQNFMPEVPAAPLDLPPGIQPEKSGVDYSKLLSALFVLLLAVLFAVTAFFAYYFIVRIRYEQKFKKADNSQRLYLLFNEVMYNLKLFRLELKPQDTILTFAEQVGDSFALDGITFLTAAKIFMKARYAGQEVTAEELRRIAAFESGIQQTLTLKRGKIRAFFLRFLYYCK